MSEFDQLQAKLKPETVQFKEIPRELKYAGSMRLKRGLKLFFLNLQTFEVKESTAKPEAILDSKGKATLHMKVVHQPNVIYIPALNLQNAKRKAVKICAGLYEKNIANV